jgi:hypothetical protein
MLDAQTRVVLMTEYEIGKETLDIIDNKNISLNEDEFDIIKCARARIYYFDILKLIEYVYGMTMACAQEMYAVVVYGKKPITLVLEDDVKKKLIA